jgi:hypothetical protein
MDDSMNSFNNISAMDISPASSPKTAMDPIPSNHLVLNAFQQQQELLSNISFNPPNINRIPDEYENNSKSLCLYSTVLTDNNDQNIPNETNQIRKRIITESLSTVNELIHRSESKSSRRLFNKTFLLIPIAIIIVYFIAQYFNTSIVLPRSSNWQNASEYLTKNLIGQDHGLEQFKDAMEKHKNFSIVIIEVTIHF